MPTVHALASHVATFDDGLATMKHMLAQVWLISRQMPRLAERFAVDNDALSEVRSAVEDLDAAIQDHAEPALAVLKRASADLLSKDDADEIEHQRIETSLRFAHLAAE